MSRTHYRIHNGELAPLLKDGADRPKLRLILRAGARAREPWPVEFVSRMVSLYRNLDESMLMSDAARSKLEQIARGE